MIEPPLTLFEKQIGSGFSVCRYNGAYAVSLVQKILNTVDVVFLEFSIILSFLVGI
jgi:hypothetical protein